jgi:hypothetical protein
VTIEPGVLPAGGKAPLRFAYKAGAQGIRDGSVAVSIPPGWPAPQSLPEGAITAVPGYSTGAGITRNANGQFVVRDLTLGASQTLTITYNYAATGTAPDPGTYLFPTSEASVRGVSLAAVAGRPPSLVVTASDGSGRVTPSPATVLEGSGDDVALRYTAASGGTSSGELAIVVPPGWSAPSTLPGHAGYTTATLPAKISVSGRTITVSDVDLLPGGSLTVDYGSGGGRSAAVAPMSAGPSRFDTSEQSSLFGQLRPLFVSPTVMVTARPQILGIFPTTGPPGMRFELTYGGGAPCSMVDFDLGQRELGTAATATGRVVNDSLTVPADERPGGQPVSVRCRLVAGHAAAVASGVFVVTAAADHRSVFVASFPTLSEAINSFAVIYHSPTAIALTVLLLMALAGLSWVLLGFPAEWFNDTWQANEERIKKLATSLLRDRVVPWWPNKEHRPANHEGTEAAAREHRTRPVLTMLWFLLVGGVLTVLVDHPSRVDESLLWAFVGISIGLAITTLGFQVPYLWRGRKGHGHLRVLGSSLVVAALFVGVSRLLDLEPPYLYGLLCVYSISPELSPEVEARTTAKSMLITLLLSLSALATDVVVSGATAASQHPSPLLLVLEAALDAVCVAGLGTLAFGLIPLPFLPGRDIARWNRGVWGLLFGLGAFCFLAVILVPEAQHVTGAPARDILSATVTFVLFALASGLLMLYFHRSGEGGHRKDLSAATETGEARLTSNDLEHGVGTVIELVEPLELVEPIELLERPALPTDDGTRG